jgi:hypothetical protein
MILFDDAMITALITGEKARENDVEPTEADSI